MLHVLVAAFADLEVRGPTVPESCAAIREGNTKAESRDKVSFILTEVRQKRPDDRKKLSWQPYERLQSYNFQEGPPLRRMDQLRVVRHHLARKSGLVDID